VRLTWPRLALILLWAWAAPLAAGIEGFESGMGAWSSNGLWQRLSSPGCVSPHAGTACMYFGRGGYCDYNDGVVKDASLTSGPINLTDPARAFISFWILYQIESESPTCYDQLRLERSYDGVTWVLEQKLSPSDPTGGSAAMGLASGSGLGGMPLWQFRRVDLSSYLGLTIYLRFRFVSSGHQAGDGLCPYTDADLDNFLGYALDDINFYDSPEPVDLKKSVAPPFGPPGTVVNYSIVAKNRDSAAQALNVWDTLPTGAVFLGGGGSLSGNRVDWAVPSLAAGASITLNLQVQVPAAAMVPQDWLNVASASGSAPGGQADSAPVLFRVRNNGLSLHKSVHPSSATTGDEITYTLLVENFTALTQSALVLQEQTPDGFLVRGSDPPMNYNAQWPISPMTPGDVRSFSLWGPAYGIDGQFLLNTAILLQSGNPVAQDSAGVTLHKPIEPQVTLRGVYPNPARSGNNAFGDFVHIVYEINQTMPLHLDIFTIAGEKLHSQELDGNRGQHEVVWDLKNDWGYGVASGVYAFRIWSLTPVKPTPEAFGYMAVLR
jgi:uncharacterized repeat protein (TIGR01451 family)